MKTLSLLAERLGKSVSYFLDDSAPDPGELVSSGANLHRARQALKEGKHLYARQLLEGVTAPELLREKLLLEARIPGADLPGICRDLPSLDEELLLRAEAALEDHQRCRNLLLAAERKTAPRWNLLMGRLLFSEQSWAAAAEHLLPAEPHYPETAAMLEVCFRELGDYRQAYEYACKQRT
jgi:hypothetical protein